MLVRTPAAAAASSMVCAVHNDSAAAAQLPPHLTTDTTVIHLLLIICLMHTLDPCVLLLQAPLSMADVVWGAAERVFDNMVARGKLDPHLPPDASTADMRAARAAAAAAIDNLLMPRDAELKIRWGRAVISAVIVLCDAVFEAMAPRSSQGCVTKGASHTHA